MILVSHYHFFPTEEYMDHIMEVISYVYPY